MNERKTDSVPKLLSNIRIMADFAKSMNVSGRSIPMNEADKVCRRAIDGYSQAIGNTEMIFPLPGTPEGCIASEL